MSREQQMGRRMLRREDPPLITGEAQFTDDRSPRGLLHAAILRSPHARARITSIDTGPAQRNADVHAVFTGEDLKETGLETIPTGTRAGGSRSIGRRVMARRNVRYTGEAVAVVLARNRYKARDALEQIRVDYEPLEPVIHGPDALDEDAPLVHESTESNLVFEWTTGDEDATQGALEEADHRVSLELVNQRLIPNSMEPRGALAEYTSSDDRLKVTMTTQNPHLHRLFLSRALDHPEHRLRIVAPRVGGGFGCKIQTYAEEAITAWCARRLGRPVKWTSTRTESYRTDSHGRDHVTRVDMGVNGDGAVTGLLVETVANLGAYVSTFGTSIPTLCGNMISGAYRIDPLFCRIRGVYTHTTPTDAYRGAGRPEASYMIERIMDRAARSLDMDPARIRRANFVDPDEFPFQSAAGPMYDSGNYARALDRALEALEYDRVRTRQKELREQGRHLGIGLSSFVENTGSAPSRFSHPTSPLPAMTESALLRFHPSGQISAYVGTSGHGQGHETTYSQVLSDKLGIPPEEIEIIEGDTERVPQGTGTFGSRSAIMGGSSLLRGAEKILQKARRLAAHMLEADPEDLEFEEGTFGIRGAPDRSATLQEIAHRAHFGPPPEGMDTGLEVHAVFDPDNFAFPFGTHAAVVEVDPDTGRVDLQRYVAVDDVGHQINPMIVEGQVVGGIAQGIGQALYEAAQYDQNGTLASGSMMDYAVPKPDHIPDIETDHTVTPSPHNPLGVKGVGECGTIAAPPAVVNAVMDALSPWDIEHLDMPLTPEKIWAAIHESDVHAAF